MKERAAHCLEHRARRDGQCCTVAEAMQTACQPGSAGGQPHTGSPEAPPESERMTMRTGRMPLEPGWNEVVLVTRPGKSGGQPDSASFFLGEPLRAPRTPRPNRAFVGVLGGSSAASVLAA
ncbi:MAG: hypothetical protein L0387_04585 [Acidobacteria bacterium]|nr:hypothetical protein [Acidobacteriota bacterium]MCI0620938.1 hypothetical protein [Acidobacteriota bacterium]MCI0720622.1 hypothetical protein [Acidobacteriota bacterium]